VDAEADDQLEEGVEQALVVDAQVAVVGVGLELGGVESAYEVDGVAGELPEVVCGLCVVGREEVGMGCLKG